MKNWQRVMVCSCSCKCNKNNLKDTLQWCDISPAGLVGTVCFSGMLLLQRKKKSPNLLGGGNVTTGHRQLERSNVFLCDINELPRLCLLTIGLQGYSYLHSHVFLETELGVHNPKPLRINFKWVLLKLNDKIC